MVTSVPSGREKARSRIVGALPTTSTATLLTPEVSVEGGNATHSILKRWEALRGPVGKPEGKSLELWGLFNEKNASLDFMSLVVDHNGISAGRDAALQYWALLDAHMRLVLSPLGIGPGGTAQSEAVGAGPGSEQYAVDSTTVE